MSPERRKVFGNTKGIAAAAAVSSAVAFGAISDVHADSPTVDSKNTLSVDSAISPKGFFTSKTQDGRPFTITMANIASDTKSEPYCPVESEAKIFVNNHSGANYTINKGILHIDAPDFKNTQGDDQFFREVAQNTISAASSITSERPAYLTINLSCINPTQGKFAEGSTIIEDANPKDPGVIEFAQVIDNKDLKKYLSENFGITDDVKVDPNATVIALGKKVQNIEDNISFVAKETPDAIYVWPVLEQKADSHQAEHFETLIFSVANPLGKNVVVLPHGELNKLPSETETQEVDSRFVMSGLFSGYKEEEVKILNTQEELNKELKNVVLYKDRDSQASDTSGIKFTLPGGEVDFEKQEVVVVTLGEKTTDGYALNLNDVTTDGESVNVVINVDEPALVCKETKNLKNQPYLIIVVDRKKDSNGNDLPVRIVKNVSNNDYKPTSEEIDGWGTIDDVPNELIDFSHYKSKITQGTPVKC